MVKPVFDAQDVEKHRLVGSIGYVLFFVPLLAGPSSRYCRFCANQGLLSLIVYGAVSLAFGLLVSILGWIPLIGWLLRSIRVAVKLIVAAVILYYAWKAYTGQAEPLPFVGGIHLIR